MYKCACTCYNITPFVCCTRMHNNYYDTKRNIIQTSSRTVQSFLVLYTNYAKLGKMQHTRTMYMTYIFLFLGVPPISPVGINSSPGRTHRIGPSSLWLRWLSWRLDSSPHGNVIFRNGLSSKRSGIIKYMTHF